MFRIWLTPCLFLLGFFTSLSAQVSADFSSNFTSGCSPVVINFSDQSTGAATTWFWNFGNGNTSTLQNPSAAYVSPGQYTVTLAVSGNGTDFEVKTNYITVFQDPISNLIATTPQGGCAPHSVSFQDQSTPGSGIINAWLWDFGDGTSTTLPSPSHTYATEDTFGVSLVVMNAFGCRDTLRDTVTIVNPVADLRDRNSSIIPNPETFS